MGIEEIDTTGQLRSEEDIQEALQATENMMLKNMLKVPPEFAVLLPTIREVLIELLILRKKGQ